LDSTILEKGFEAMPTLKQIMKEVESTFPSPRDYLNSPSISLKVDRLSDIHDLTRDSFKRLVTEMVANSQIEFVGVRYYTDENPDQLDRYSVSIYVDFVDSSTRFVRSLTKTVYVPIPTYQEKPYRCSFTGIIVGYDTRIITSYVERTLHREIIDFLNNMELSCAYPKSNQRRQREDYRFDLRVRPSYHKMG
jgi:hypothetical protein